MMDPVDWILHVDLDQFIAAVELSRRPELRGTPIVVGGAGDPTQRGVVATASYEAREFGIGSGMPLRVAARRCPDAVFLPSDTATYQEVSQRVMATLRELPVLVEVLGWDEAFLGAHTDAPEGLAGEVRAAVDAETGLSCSVGIGDNKLRAKLATGFAKPAGIYRLTERNWTAVMAQRPTDALVGIGRKTAKKLAELGVHTVGELAAADRERLAGRFGPTMGPWYRVLAHGVGDTEVSTTPYVPRSHSREKTFQQDLIDFAEVADQIVTLAECVADGVAAEGRLAGRVAVKVRYAPFVTRTHSVELPTPTTEAAEISRAALELLEHFERARPIRLLGVRAEFAATSRPTRH